MNTEKEMHIAVSKFLRSFEVLHHGKQAHAFHWITKVLILFFLL
jgi:hypothetical protein